MEADAAAAQREEGGLNHPETPQGSSVESQVKALWEHGDKARGWPPRTHRSSPFVPEKVSKEGCALSGGLREIAGRDAGAQTEDVPAMLDFCREKSGGVVGAVGRYIAGRKISPGSPVQLAFAFLSAWRRSPADVARAGAQLCNRIVDQGGEQWGGGSNKCMKWSRAETAREHRH